MAKYWVTISNEYYESVVDKRANPEDMEVTQRPDRFYDWSGSAWVLNKDRKRQKIIEYKGAEMEAARIETDAIAALIADGTLKPDGTLP